MLLVCERNILRCTFFSTWSTKVTQSQLKSQQITLWIFTTDFKVYAERQKTKNNQHSSEEEQSQGTVPIQL